MGVHAGRHSLEQPAAEPPPLALPRSTGGGEEPHTFAAFRYSSFRRALAVDLPRRDIHNAAPGGSSPASDFLP